MSGESFRVSNAPGPNPGIAGSFLLPTVAAGESQTITAGELGLAGSPPDAEIDIAREPDGAISIALDAPHGDVRNIFAKALDDPITLSNFVHTQVRSTPQVSVDITVVDASSADIKGSRESDTISVSAADDTGAGDNSFAIGAGAGDDIITFTASAGGGGSAWIGGGDGNDWIASIGDSADTLKGGAGDDTIFGGGGNDWIEGGHHNDVLHGEDGDDMLFGGGHHDQLFGGDGADTLHGCSGNDTLRGGDGDDLIMGESGSSLAYGDLGNDIVHGGNAADILYGGDGSFASADGDDQLFGGNSHDRLFGENGNDTLDGGKHRDTLDGGRGDDLLIGGHGSDDLFGFADNDELFGGSGADHLYGEDGNDTLRGGEHNDIYFFGRVAEAGASNFDVIFDDGPRNGLVVYGNDASLNPGTEGVFLDDIALSVDDGGLWTLAFVDNPDDGEISFDSGVITTINLRDDGEVTAALEWNFGAENFMIVDPDDGDFIAFL